MFCPNCGKKTSDGARFCANCGCKLDAAMQQSLVMPTAPTTKFVPAKCTNCGGALEVDPSQDAAICKYCNTPFIVEKAIQNFTINTNGPITVGAATINVGGINIENYLVRARDFVSQGNTTTAIKYYEDILDVDFKNEDARKGITNIFLSKIEKAIRIHNFDMAKQLIRDLKKTGYCSDKNLITLKEQKLWDVAEKPLFDEPIYDGIFDTTGKGRLQISRTTVSIIKKDGTVQKYKFKEYFAEEPDSMMNQLHVKWGKEMETLQFPGLMDGRKKAKEAIEVVSKIKSGY